MPSEPLLIEIRALAIGDAEACDGVIASLPYHFGVAEGVRAAAEAVRSEAGLVAMVDGELAGFLTIERHFAGTAEITWMAVHANRRGQGVGAALIAWLREQLIAEGRQILLVFTAAAAEDDSRVADNYERTRRFYRSQGFIPAREFSDLWPRQPALLLIMSLSSPTTSDSV